VAIAHLLVTLPDAGVLHQGVESIVHGVSFGYCLESASAKILFKYTVSLKGKNFNHGLNLSDAVSMVKGHTSEKRRFHEQTD
jgi:hypothetical protein